jgi:hypothetical protein
MPAAADGAPFRLVKWYFDCVVADGRVVIGYWASIAWRGIALTWQNITVFEPGGTPISRSSLRPSPSPEVVSDTIVWNAGALSARAQIDSTQRPIEERLLASESGVVDWRVVAPAALVTVKLDGYEHLQGSGYAERIEMTIPPWRLPIRELRWGRWVDGSANHSLVWIDWAGSSPRSWVFLDGFRVPCAVVTGDGVGSALAELVLGERRVLHTRALAEIAATIPPLEAMLPKSILALQETKWCSAAALLRQGSSTTPGSSIYELAVFG